MSNDLVAWLEEQIAKDECDARDASHWDRHTGTWTIQRNAALGDALVDVGAGARVVTGAESALPHVARWDPARAQAECDAKRRIIEECAKLLAVDGWEYDDAPNLADRTLRLLAVPYAAAGAPGYREEWKP